MKRMMMAVLLIASLVLNAILIQQRLEKRFYQRGVTDGVRQMGDKVINEVQTRGRLNVKMADGRQVVLVTVPDKTPPASAKVQEDLKP